jgi:hypothetical protein
MQWWSKHASIATEELLGNGVLCRDLPEAPYVYWGSQAAERGELRESFETIIEDDGEEKT